MKKFFATIFAVLTLFCSMSPVNAEAAKPDDGGISICSSDYLGSYNAYAQKGVLSGEMDISYLVSAPIRATKIGVSKIEIYKGLNEYVTTIYGSVANGLQGSDIGVHAGTYTYKGTAGTEYYAKVTIFASNSSGSDSRTIITNSVIV